jgi:hypothetical protein
MQGWLLWFALTASFSLMGVGMASWQSGMAIGGPMHTAHIGVEFTDSLGSQIQSSPPAGWEDPVATASINRVSEKQLEINIQNAYPGLQVHFWYEVKNTGTLPLKRKDYNLSLPGDITTYQTSAPPNLIQVNSASVGEIFLQVSSDIEQQESYTYTMQIEYVPDI